MAIVQYKDGTKNEVPNADLSYWISQGWKEVKPTTSTPTITTSTPKFDATLYGPNGQKEAVKIGSARASQLQSQGWGLTPGSYKAPTTTPIKSPTYDLPIPSPTSPTKVTSNKYLFIDPSDRYIKVENGQQSYVPTMAEVEALLAAGFKDMGRTGATAILSPTSTPEKVPTYTDEYTKYGVDPEKAYYSARDLETAGLDWNNLKANQERPYDKIMLSPDKELTKMQELYNYLTKATTSGVTRGNTVSKLDPRALNLLGSMPKSQTDVRSAAVNNLLALYRDAFIYGGYTKDDILNDLYERQQSRTNPDYFGTTLKNNSEGRRIGQGIIHPDITRDPWIATTFSPADAAETPLDPKPADKPAETKPGSNDVPVDAPAETPATPYDYKADVPVGQDAPEWIKPVITEFGGTETHPVYDLLLSDLKAKNELERDQARYNYKLTQERGSEDKAATVEETQDNYRAAGIYGSGIEARGEKKVADAYLRNFEDTRRGYYTRDASEAEIDRLPQEQVDKLRMAPSTETAAAIKDLRDRMKASYPKAPKELEYMQTDSGRTNSTRDMTYGGQRLDTLRSEQSQVGEDRYNEWLRKQAKKVNPNTGYIMPSEADAYNPYR